MLRLRLLAAFGLLLLCPACLGTPMAGAARPAPLNATAIDDQAINFGYEAFDAVLTLIDAGIASGQIVPGSPRALKIRDHLATTKRWLNSAKLAQEAGSQTDYLFAFMHARGAIAEARKAIKGEQP
jgi:hypothetical protein